MQICIFADFIDFDERKVSTADSAVAHELKMFKSMKKRELQNVNRKSAKFDELIYILNFNNKFSDVTHDVRTECQ